MSALARSLASQTVSTPDRRGQICHQSKTTIHHTRTHTLSLMEQREFETIATTLRAKAFSVALRMMPTDDDAQDAASEVMLRLWTLHDEIKDAEHAVKLATVVSHNICIDCLRTHKKTYTLSPDTAIINTATPSEILQIREDEQWLLHQIERLPPREQQILRMRQIEQRTNQEIARLLGIGEASVKVMLSRARKTLFNDIKKRLRQ